MSSIIAAMVPAAKECSSLTSPSFVNLCFSLFILLGILVSYLPQHHRIISRGTSEGISPIFLLLGVTSGTCAFINILILSGGVLGCCTKGIGGFNCFAASLGVLQVGVQWTCFAVILILFILYFPTAALTPPSTSPSNLPTTRTARTITLLSVVHFMLITTITLYLATTTTSPETPHIPETPPLPSQALTTWANFLGVQSTLLASMQYIPQLYTTWKLKHVGSLSITMMCIQTPGSFVWAISLASREGTSWSSWITYVVTGFLQGGLLTMCILWEIKERSKVTKGVEDDDERTALLGEGR
ncbi:hypothetical protein RUND412_002762 [Rhizina undulata]